MKILVVSDEECDALWNEYAKTRLREYDLIISCGDLKADYLSFLVSLARCPVLYVHGNHDTSYERRPPEGCDCIDGKVVEYNGLRIAGLGGCRRYHPGAHQYTEKEMRKRIRSLRFPLWRSHGVDILVTHSPAQGLGDGEDPAHRGFAALTEFLDRQQPAFMFHGHVHLRFNHRHVRELSRGRTRVINASERFELEIEDRPVAPRYKNVLRWKNGAPKPREPLYENSRYSW